MPRELGLPEFEDQDWWLIFIVAYAEGIFYYELVVVEYTCNGPSCNNCV